MEAPAGLNHWLRKRSSCAAAVAIAARCVSLASGPGTPTRISRQDYLPFGDEFMVLDTNQNTTNTRKFTGHERDPESGLDYMLARYYSSSLGRFMTVDPSHGSVATGAPQTLNRYSYVLNSPWRLTDPNGKLTVDTLTASVFPKAVAFIMSLRPTFNEYNAYRKVLGAEGLKLDVDKAFTPGQGQKVIGKEMPLGQWGNTPPRNPSIMEVSATLLAAFENDVVGSKALLQVTVMHEVVHYLDSKDGHWLPFEPGKEFEELAYGTRVSDTPTIWGAGDYGLQMKRRHGGGSSGGSADEAFADGYSFWNWMVAGYQDWCARNHGTFENGC